jgi:hypothetical protein
MINMAILVKDAILPFRRKRLMLIACCNHWNRRPFQPKVDGIQMKSHGTGHPTSFMIQAFKKRSKSSAGKSISHVPPGFTLVSIASPNSPDALW